MQQIYSIYSSLLVFAFVVCSLHAGVNQVRINGTQTNFNTGDSVFIDVVFDEVVTVSLTGNIPYLKLQMNHNSVVNADLVRGSGSETLTFLYKIKNGDSSSKLNYPDVTSLILNNSQIFIQGTSTPATILLPRTTSAESLGNSNIVITDNKPPQIISSYVTGDLTYRSLIPAPGGKVCFQSAPECSGTGYIYVEFDEGLAGGIDSTYFNISAANQNPPQFCSLTNGNGGTLTSGDTVIRLEYKLEFLSPSLKFDLQVIKNISDLNSNEMQAGPGAPVSRSLEANGPGRYRMELVDNSAAPAKTTRILIGLGNTDPRCDEDHDHVDKKSTELYIQVPDVITSDPFFSSSIFDNYIQNTVYKFTIFAKPTSAEPIIRTLRWTSTLQSGDGAQIDLNDDYVLYIRSLAGDNTLLKSPVNMLSASSIGSHTFSTETGFEVLYGPIQKIDSQNPTILSCPPARTLRIAPGECSVPVPDLTGEILASDDFDSTLTVSQNIAANTAIGSGVHIIKLTVEDDVFRQSSCGVQITVPADNEDPKIVNCPSSDINVNANENCQAAVSWTEPTATDNCPSVNLSSNFTPPHTFPVGTTTVTYTATDAASNSVECRFDVVVKDNTVPVITVDPGDVTLPLNSSAPDRLSGVSVIDNCSNSLTPNDIILGGDTVDMTTAGNYTVTYNISDSAANAAVSRSRTYRIVIGSRNMALQPGWNNISLSLEPDDRLIRTLFSNVIAANNLKEVLGNGDSFNPNKSDSLNTLRVLEIGKGYWVNLTTGVTLTIEGMMIDSNKMITLNAGWNNIGYFPGDERDVRVTLSDLIDTGTPQDSNLICIIGGGKSYNPRLPDSLNTLSTLNPGRSYWIKVNTNGSFMYR